jgi:SAM-dependent methyltransferase
MKVIRPLLITQAACNLTAQTADLAHHFQNVQRVPDALDGQHPIRLWEYAMTLRAIDAWRATLHPSAQWYAPHIADVGGATSNFWKVLRQQVTRVPVSLIDPNYPEHRAGDGYTMFPHEIASALVQYPDLREAFDVVTCISVLEHLPPAAVNGFLTDLTRLLKPGGLLCLTCDYGDYQRPSPDQDRHHFHWMREQIFDFASIVTQVLDPLDRLGYNLLGGTDLQWTGAQVFDYTMAALALVYQPSEKADEEPT